MDYLLYWHWQKKLFEKDFFSKESITSQSQPVIKLVEQKDRRKHFIKKRRPISLLNIDAKLILKVLERRIKNTLPSLISSNQTAFAEKRIISEGEIISDILELSDILKTGLLVTLLIEKAIDSINHVCLIIWNKRIWLWKKNCWIKILLKLKSLVLLT